MGPFGRAWRAARWGALVLLALSCTRMPTAPAVEITVHGVISGPDGPIGGATLFFLADDLGGFHLSTETDSQGAYSIVLRTGTFIVHVLPGREGVLDHVEQVAFTRSSTRYDHRFGGHRVTGTVRDPDGAVVDSGIVYVRPQVYTNQDAHASLRNGAYSLLLPPGLYSLSVLTDYWSGLSPRAAESFSVRSDTTMDIHFEGIPVSGTILGPDRNPRRNVAVEAVGPAGGRRLTDSDGHYRLWVTPPGPYHFEIWPWDSSYIVSRVAGPLSIDAPLTLDGDLSGVEWTGMVARRATQEPVAGVSVRVNITDMADRRGARSVTDAAGNFRLVLEPDRTYELSTYDGYGVAVHARGLVAATDTTFELLLDTPPSP